MRQPAIHDAKRRLRYAGRALERLNTADDLDDAEEAWDHFLSAFYKVYEKLRAGAHQTSSWPWFLRKLDERENDELLAFVYASRNSDTHRLEPVGERRNLNLLRGEGVQSYRFGGTVMHFAPAGARVEHVAGEHFVLRPVKNRDPRTKEIREYDIPRLHRGKLHNKVRDTLFPSYVGNLALSYLRELVEEASRLR